MNLLKIISIFDIRQKVSLIFIIIAIIIGSFLEIFGIGIILPIIKLLGDKNYTNIIIHNKLYICLSKVLDLDLLNNTQNMTIVLIIFLIVVFFLKQIYIYIMYSMQVNFAVKNQIRYSEKLLYLYYKKPYEYYFNVNTSRLIKNINNFGVTVFNNIIVMMLLLLSEGVVILFLSFGLMFYIGFSEIIIILLLFIFVSIIVIMIFKNKINRYGTIQNETMSCYLKWVTHGFSAIKEIKVLGKESFFIDKFKKSYSLFAIVNGEYFVLNQIPRLIIEYIVILFICIIIITKIYSGSSFVDIVSLMSVLSLAAFRLLPSITRILNYINIIRFNMPLFNELYEDLLYIKSKDTNICTNKIEKIEFKEKIEIEGITFYYENNRKIINNISFCIDKGKFVGIIGESGAGKTTFVDILLGLLIPQQGLITVDGINIFDNIRGWQSNIAYVPQSIYLMDATIRENIAFGVDNDNIDNELIDKVLKMAELYDFVYKLPEGVNTNIGERGIKLSGGQRQRIGIARALYNKPEVLILDEATAALDSKTEKNITDTILKLKGQVTIIAIAHRLSTLEQCDFKVKFENGEAKII